MPDLFAGDVIQTKDQVVLDNGDEYLVLEGVSRDEVEMGQSVSVEGTRRDDVFEVDRLTIA